MKYYILVDASYYIFYRFHALVKWWKFSHPEEPAENLHENDEFTTKFRSVFVSKFEEIPKKLKLPKDADITFVVGRDCPRENIWRSHLYSPYKGTRRDYSTSKLNPGPFFKMVYDENLFEQTNFDEFVVLQHEYLEADDSLAITTKCIRKNMKDKEYHIYIIASDTDYLQLCEDDVSLRTLAYKDVRTPKNSYFNPTKDLLYKIIIGDKSDNIPPIFKKQCKKKAKEYCEDPELFSDHAAKDEDIANHFIINQFLIDFEKIPARFVGTVLKALE